MISIRVEMKDGTFNIVPPLLLHKLVREDKVKKFYRHIDGEWVDAECYSTRSTSKLKEGFIEKRRVS